MTKPSAHTLLRAIKSVHTVAWAFFATCIIAIPLCARQSNYRLASMLIATVLAECLIVLLNHFKCPLTPIAARFTENRRDNFDIYLPEWLARYNKTIFGSLYVAGSIYTLFRWLSTS
jgi:hypothetical protein